MKSMTGKKTVLGLSLVCGLVFAQSAAAQSKPARPAITGIAHLVVLDEDLAAAKHFYGDVIGWPASKPFDPTDTVHYQVGLKQYIEVKTAPSHNPPDRVSLLAFETTDVRALRAYLAANGVTVPAKVERHANGALSFDVVDPDGYHIEFTQGGKFPAPSPDAISTHLIHSGFAVRNEPAAKHFYLDILGFKPYWHGWQKDAGHVEGMDDYMSIQVPDGSDWVEFMLSEGRDVPVGSPTHNPHHFAPGVVSVAAAYAIVQKRDPALAAKVHPQQGRDGKGQLNLFDPDHTRVEFMDFQPHEKPCCSDFTASSPQPQP
jgi:catechol 2,3-dioxygenase-like lactoylglutathione lyase family enzyme